MIVQNGLKKNTNLTASAVTIGKFEALHAGHRKLFRAIVREEKKGLNSVVIMVRKPSDRDTILTEKEAERELDKIGVDLLVKISLHEKMQAMAPEKFVQSLIDRLSMKSLVVGEDFCFGKNRGGDIATLKEMSLEKGFHLVTVPKENRDGVVYSSSRIKKALQSGDMDYVQKAMENRYGFSGTVVEGHQIGRLIGYPTVNIPVPAGKLLPKNGVYLSEVRYRHRIYRGITNIGYKPTVHGEEKSIETYILDFNRTIYGETVEIRPLSYIRPEKYFSSLEALQKQLKKDEKFAEQYAR